MCLHFVWRSSADFAATVRRWNPRAFLPESEQQRVADPHSGGGRAQTISAQSLLLSVLLLLSGGRNKGERLPSGEDRPVFQGRRGMRATVFRQRGESLPQSLRSFLSHPQFCIMARGSSRCVEMGAGHSAWAVAAAAAATRRACSCSPPTALLAPLLLLLLLLLSLVSPALAAPPESGDFAILEEAQVLANQMRVLATSELGVFNMQVRTWWMASDSWRRKCTMHLNAQIIWIFHLEEGGNQTEFGIGT